VMLTMVIATIGYSGWTIEEFIGLLKKKGVETIVDVRNNPFSRKPDFSKNKLKDHLQRASIDYIHIPELGIPSKDRKDAKTEADVKILFGRYKEDLTTKSEALDRVISLGRKKTIALLCLEKDHHDCHRGIIAERLEQLGERIIHIQ